MLEPQRTWPSPTPEVMFSGTISFNVLLEWGYERMGFLPWQCWWSRLARRCSLIRDHGAARWLMVLLPVKFGLVFHLVDGQ